MAAEPVYGITDIMKLLPHRFPFLLVDRVDELVRPQGATRLGWRIRARKCVTVNEHFFAGHFPHRPVMPGVLQVEAMAQAAAIICLSLEEKRMDVSIATIENAKFRRPVVPGDVLDIFAEIVKDRGSIVIVACRIEVDGQVVSETEVMAKMFPLVEG